MFAAAFSPTAFSEIAFSNVAFSFPVVVPPNPPAPAPAYVIEGSAGKRRTRPSRHLYGREVYEDEQSQEIPNQSRQVPKQPRQVLPQVSPAEVEWVPNETLVEISSTIHFSGIAISEAVQTSRASSSAAFFAAAVSADTNAVSVASRKFIFSGSAVTKVKKSDDTAAIAMAMYMLLK